MAYKNPQKQREYREAHREQMREYQRVWAERKKLGIVVPNKSCAECSKSLRVDNKTGFCSEHYTKSENHRSSSRRWARENSEYMRASARERRKDPDYRKHETLKFKYNITLLDFRAMEKEQDGRCAICQEVPDKTLEVDHDHNCCAGDFSCGKCIRGLLCHGCNFGIGGFKDNVKSLIAAIAYLNKGVRPK